MKLKYGEKAKLCCAYTDSFILYVKKDEIHKEAAEDVETRFDISSYELNIPLPKCKNKKVIGIMKDELETYNYLIDNGSENKNHHKRHQKVCHKKKS